MKRLFLLLLGLLLTFAPAPGAASASAARTGGAPRATGLHVVGSLIVNDAGQPVRLVGVNRSSAEYACVNNWGIFEGPADAGEVAAMQSWSVRAVRVALNESCWLGGFAGLNPAYAGTAYQDAIAAYVGLLTSSGIAVILNLHWNAAGNAVASGQEAMADRDHSVAFWQSVAARFRGNGAVLFEPFNEAHPDDGDVDAAWRCWRDGGVCAGVGFVAAGMQELVSAIRSTGATNVIIATGTNWGSSVDRWLEYRPVDPLGQLVVGWHSYGDGLSCQDEACWNSVLLPLASQVPVVATEIGEFDCGHSYIDRVMGFLDAVGGGYLAWSWGPFDCSRDPALLTSWSGAPTATYGVGFKAHLNCLELSLVDGRRCDLYSATARFRRPAPPWPPTPITLPRR